MCVENKERIEKRIIALDVLRGHYGLLQNAKGEREIQTDTPRSLVSRPAMQGPRGLASTCPSSHA